MGTGMNRRLQDGRGERGASTCPVCGSGVTEPFFETGPVPVLCNVLWDSKDAALKAPTAQIRLAFCPNCGHAFNLTFDPTLLEYAQGYENSLHFSPSFQQHATTLAAHLIDRHNLRGKDIIEIGSGQGDFLRMLCSTGGNHGVGFDPSYAPESGGEPEDGTVRFVRDLFSRAYSDVKADFICCRHVLEHVPDPRALLNTVHDTMARRPASTAYFEVPNAHFTLHDLGIWDLIYEHYSYFSAASLSYLFTSAGFRLLDLAESFGGQFLGIEVALGNASGESTPPEPLPIEDLAPDVGSFARRYARKVNLWASYVARLVREGRRPVAWGTGSKGVTFLNVLNARDTIEVAVDINPRKHGLHVPVTGQQVVPPTYLRQYRPDAVIVMNPIYLDEIRHTCSDMGIRPEFRCAS
jgi:SAM-dependent methyltransferase